MMVYKRFCIKDLFTTILISLTIMNSDEKIHRQQKLMKFLWIKNIHSSLKITLIYKFYTRLNIGTDTLSFY